METRMGVQRRGFIKAAAAAGAAVLTAGAASAQDEKKAGGRLPPDTPITKMGFIAKEIDVMTAAARKLTKGDMSGIQKLHTKAPNLTTAQVLEAYGKEAKMKITVEDIQSVQKAFHMREDRQHAAGALKSNVEACCCCCPCCSCTASVVVAPRIS